MLTHLQEYIRHAPVDEAEVAGIERNRVGAHPVEQAVIHAGGELFEQRFALTLQALSIDDIRAPLPLLHHLRNQLRRVLQVDVDDDERAAAGGVHAAGYGELMAKIAGEGEHAHLRRPGGYLSQNFQRVIPAAVVDIDDLIRMAGCLHGGIHALKGRLEHFLLVKNGNDERQ